MTPYQYTLCARGYFLRVDRKEEGLRRIWQLLYNVNSKKGKGITSLGRLRQFWPLSTDNLTNIVISKEEIKRRFAAARANSQRRNEQAQKLKNGNAEA